MIAQIKFNLPEEREQFDRALRADDAWIALRDVDNLCRNLLKHGGDYKTPEELAEDIRQMIADHGELL